MRTFLRLAALTLTLFLVLVAGIRLGANPLSLPQPLRALAGPTDETAFNEAARLVRDDYYRPIPTSQIQDRGVQGVVASLHDRFSAYLDPAAYKAFQHSENPHFSGIGLNVAFSKRGLLITSVFAGTPAQKAGLKAGELVVSVNGRPLAGKSINSSVGLVTGPPGSPVRIGVVSKAGKPRTLRLKRATIHVPSVRSKMVIAGNGKKIGVVALSGFVRGAGAQVSTATKRLLRLGATGIVLDLRSNGGGLLNEGVAVGSVFIAKGRIVSTKGRNRAEQVYEATGNAIPSSIPVVVLVDRGTASASEIVAGAIQDTHRGLVVGTRTFGKGVFQEVTPLTNGGALDITVGEYFTPSGRNLGGGGVKAGSGLKPNVAVPASATPAAALAAAVLAASQPRHTK